MRSRDRTLSHEKSCPLHLTGEVRRDLVQASRLLMVSMCGLAGPLRLNW